MLIFIAKEPFLFIWALLVLIVLPGFFYALSIIEKKENPWKLDKKEVEMIKNNIFLCKCIRRHLLLKNISISEEIGAIHGPLFKSEALRKILENRQRLTPEGIRVCMRSLRKQTEKLEKVLEIVGAKQIT